MWSPHYVFIQVHPSNFSQGQKSQIKNNLHYQGCSFPNRMSVNFEGLFQFSVSSELFSLVLKTSQKNTIEYILYADS